MKESFADESWRGNRWYRPIFSAHVKSYQGLSWFFQLENEAKKRGLYSEELKASRAIAILNLLDSTKKRKIWQYLQNTIIIIIEPNYYIKKFGIEISKNSALQYESNGKKVIIEKSDQLYTQFVSLLQEHIPEWLLLDSPLSDIEFALESVSEKIELFPKTDIFSPEKILEIINEKDLKKRVMNVTMLTLRLNSAFFEINDPETKNCLKEKLFKTDIDYLWAVPRYYLELLNQSISSNRFFDEGHSSSIKILKSCYRKVKTYLRNEIFNPECIMPDTKIEEVDSKRDKRIQASDVAAGIALRIYERQGIKGLRKDFNYIIYNGRKL